MLSTACASAPLTGTDRRLVRHSTTHPAVKRVMCAHFPCWPLQRILCAQPERRNRPLVLYTDEGRAPTAGWSGRRVAFCCPMAAARGVAPGMRLAEAQGLLGHRPQVGPSRASREPAFVLHRPDDDSHALRRLAAWCRRFSPVTGVEEPDSLLLDLTGCTHLFGDERRLAGRFHQAVQRWGLSARTAIADTIGAAWAVAHFGNERAAAVAAGQQSAALNPLPVAALRLSATAVRTLQELDVRRVEQLRALPRAGLASRIGAGVCRRLDQALGDLCEQISPVHIPEPVEAHWEGEYPAGNRRELEIVLQGLVEQVVDAFAATRDGIQQLDARLLAEEQPAVEFTVGLLRASRSVPHLMSLVRAKLERIVLKGPVTGVRLKASAAAPLEIRQSQLFDCEDDGGERRELDRLVDLLSNRLGRDRVLRPRLHPDAQPEYAVQWTPLLETGEGEEPAAPLCLPDSARPLRLLEKPRAVQVTSVVPEGPPLQLFGDHAAFTIARCWGPERIETGWWRGPDVRRDYYRVETACGRWLWLYRRIEQGDWFLHGEFE